MTAAEAAERERGEQIRMQLERLLNEGIPGMGVCITSEGEVIPVGAKEYEKISQLLREKLESVKPLFTDSNNQCAQMVVTKPEETAASRRAYVGKPTPLVDALRSALVFRQIGTRYDLKLRREGEIDDEELWRLAAGDERVFSERVIEGRPECLIGMLVDLSGSMEGPHLATAQRLAQTMLWALYGQDGVETQVWGHTGDVGDVGDGGGSSVYRLWEPGDPMSRLGLISALPHGNNYDGFAIAHCIKQMIPAPQEQKVLIVLSDGYPAGSGYGGIPAQNHMRMVSDWGRRQGVETIQIAIDDAMRLDDQARMFGHGNFIPYTTDAALPRELTKLLDRFTR
jgi:hypothetical protein